MLISLYHFPGEDIIRLSVDTGNGEAQEVVLQQNASITQHNRKLNNISTFLLLLVALANYKLCNYCRRVNKIYFQLI